MRRALIIAALLLAAAGGYLAWLAKYHPLCQVRPNPSRAQAEQMIQEEWREQSETARADLSREWGEKAIAHDGKVMRWLEQSFGDKPADGWSLFISLHGGGGATSDVNDQQWRNQIRLYQHPGAIFVAPRAPTDNWNLWHEPHIDPMLDRLIAGAIIVRGVNPNKVYLLGYSAGGDGVYQLGPRMADRFAAASMMAGHPNDASPLGLRNLPFAIWCGANDGAYNRNRVAAEWIAKLGELRQADPGGYVHSGHIVPGKGHWMDLEDRAAVAWMAGFTRNPWPRTVVWRQSTVLHRRFYWLEVPEGVEVDAGETVRARVEGQVISLETDHLRDLTLLLSDRLVDLDKEVVVKVRDRVVFEGRVGRGRGIISESLLDRLDPESAATARLTLAW